MIAGLLGALLLVLLNILSLQEARSPAHCLVIGPVDYTQGAEVFKLWLLGWGRLMFWMDVINEIKLGF
jgi:hypothetical protein